jgi:hypothetical protein
MSNKIRNLMMLLATAFLGATGQILVRAQIAEPPAGAPDLQRRCSTVAVASDGPLLPARVIATYLEQQADFQASKLALTNTPQSADAVVTLTPSGARDARIHVANRMTAQYAAVTSAWTDFRGMIVSAVMEQLRSACPGSVVASATPRRAAVECHKPPAELRTVATLAACSQTSWMDTGDIYHALESRSELKQSGLHVTPGCEGGDAVLDITHNLNLTVEWFWILRAQGGKAISNGKVIAFDKREAASKIAAAVTHEIASAHGAEVQTASAGNSSAEKAFSEGRTVRALLLPTDFSVPDTRTSLYIDSERVTARDISNRVIFDVKREQIRDARLHADWRRSFQLSDPTPLALRAAQNVGTLAEDVGAGFAEVEPDQPRRFCRGENAGGQYDFCTAVDLGKSALSTAGLIGYLTAGTVLAQIPTKAEILEIAWEHDGAVKTVALQVPLHESKRLLRALHPAGAIEPEQACSPTLAATSQK